MLGLAGTGAVTSTGGLPSTSGAFNCTINSVLYPNGTPNPSNACQVCLTTVSTTAWVQLSEGASCGAAGAGTVCHGGTCQSGCWIESAYYATSATNSNGPCQTCQPTVSTTTWTSDSATCGCTGIFEGVQSSTGLCVAKMAIIVAPIGSYSIDVTEVTRDQYEGWVTTEPALPASTDASCGWKSTGSYAADSNCMTLSYVCQSGCGHQPVVCVDWCDAYAYCSGIGKRLCGAIGEGSVNFSVGYTDASLSQWYRACSSGGTNTYPYGNTYDGSICDGYDYSGDNINTCTTVTVGSLGNCVTLAAGYAGVYDLSGNVWEWEDSCDSTGQSANCRLRGGSFGNNGVSVTCGGDESSVRYNAHDSMGFRCCSP